ncbi:CDP-glycerol glycerophosphotransferase family protein [bacterium]|nr:CDP-glycerol glycerophosphotransferase family protein [bacterium]
MLSFIKKDKKRKRVIIKFLFIKISLKSEVYKKIIRIFPFNILFAKSIINELAPIIRFLDLIVPKKQNKIVFSMDYNQMAKSAIYYEYLKKNYPDDYEIVILLNRENLGTRYKELRYLYNLRGAWDCITSKYVVATNCNGTLKFFKSNRHKYVFLWHGMPIKRVGLIQCGHHGKAKTSYYNLMSKYAYFFVTSDIFKISMACAFKTDYNRVFITGEAITDLIADTSDDKKIKEWFNIDKYSKVVFYAPTWKMSAKTQKNTQISKEFNNIFYLDDFNEESFIRTIEDNNILFIMKPHPMDEFFYRKHPEVIPSSDNFKIIYNDDLVEKDVRFYTIYKFIDLMISDYSSAPLDYLYLNRPVVWINSLAEDYGKHKGMTLEDNFEMLMLGPKVVTYKNLEKEVIDGLYNDSQRAERERLLPLIHKYRDFNSCERIYDVMKNL